MKHDGFVIVESFMPSAGVEAMRLAIEDGAIHRLSRGGADFGGRNLLALDGVRAFVDASATRVLLAPFGDDLFAVRALFFDKTAEANWPVAWHQDLSVALSTREDVEGWTAWTMKGGVVHAHPPVDILERMVTLRLHLDDCGADNGPLRVLPGSHAVGRIVQDGIAHWRATVSEAVCTGSAGSVMLMRPLILHASSRSRAPAHRRVLQIEFAPKAVLPAPLRWAA